MQSRLLKQLIYGILYLVIFAAAGYGVFLFFRAPASCTDNLENQGEAGVDCGGPCAPCELRDLSPIEIRRTSVFNVGEGRATLFVELRNPNPRYGATRYAYAARLYGGRGETVGAIEKTTFIYPGEIKFVVEPSAVTGSAARAEVEGRVLAWESAAAFSRPEVSTRAVGIEVNPREAEVTVSGVAINESVATLARLVVTAIIAEASGVPVAAGKTLLLRVEPREERQFRVVVPEVRIPAVARDSVTVSLEAER